LIILGIDPGYATTGFGVIETDGYDFRMLDCGAIITPPGDTLSQRILQTVEDLLSLLEQFHPDQIAIEEIFFSKNVTTALKVAESRGAIIYEFARQGMPVTEYKPNQVKINICGYGSAAKIQVQKMVQILLNLKDLPKPDDAADALAIAICHANHFKNQNPEQNHA
jgi:crossover junction endodeoxyribonuclease RuvC